jgi:replicative DNA helicase
VVELQLLNKVIANKSLAVIRQNGITEEHFVIHKEEFMFINEHYQKYGNVPDIATILEKYPDFENLDVGESDKYLIEKLNEQLVCNKMLPVLYKIRDYIEDKQADKALKYAREEFSNLIKEVGFKPGYDIVANAVERENEFNRRKELKGLLGISSGLQEIDELLHGWLPGEDFISIIGRTNEGKSWVLLYF